LRRLFDSRIRNLEVGAYIQRMPHKPIELPPAVARRFVEDMRAFFAEKSTIEADEIAASCTRSSSTMPASCGAPT
jgi:hypothetical protein